MKKLKPIMSRIFYVAEEKIGDDATMKDVPGWNSLTHMDFILSIEQEFGVMLSGDEIADMQDVKAIEQVLAKHGVK